MYNYKYSFIATFWIAFNTIPRSLNENKYSTGSIHFYIVNFIISFINALLYFILYYVLIHFILYFDKRNIKYPTTNYVFP